MAGAPFGRTRGGIYVPQRLTESGPGDVLLEQSGLGRRYRRPRDAQGITVPIDASSGKYRGWHKWEFHPDHPEVENHPQQPPEWFIRELEMIDPNLTVCWHPRRECWQLWERGDTPGVHSWRYSPGWRRLMLIRRPDGSYCPLDNRVFALLYRMDAQRYGGAKKFQDELIRREEELEAVSQKDQREQDRAWMKDRTRFWKIKNIGSGMKFQKYTHGGPFDRVEVEGATA